MRRLRYRGGLWWLGRSTLERVCIVGYLLWLAGVLAPALARAR
jgi:hypothetical protein